MYFFCNYLKLHKGVKLTCLYINFQNVQLELPTFCFHIKLNNILMIFGKNKSTTNVLQKHVSIRPKFFYVCVKIKLFFFSNIIGVSLLIVDILFDNLTKKHIPPNG